MVSQWVVLLDRRRVAQMAALSVAQMAARKAAWLAVQTAGWMAALTVDLKVAS
jgi:hypothetical protein